MLYQWQFQPYRRRFKQALQTSYGCWTLREGMIVQLVNEAGAIGWGEIAPIPWFGSETLEQAVAFCHQLPSELSNDLIFSIPDAFPSCQFAFESAWEEVKHPHQHSTSELYPTPHSVLLPTGEAALTAWKPLWEKGFRTFKWKIGVQTIATELELLHTLARCLPAATKLRLDANGGLSLDDAARWLETCDAIVDDPSLPVTLEYFEQPLAVSQFQAMQNLSHCYRTPIALDESVATLQQLQVCYENGWRGIIVIKPAIVGSPFQLRQFCQARPIDAVFSSAFETVIGRQAGLRLATALGNLDRAMGYGTNHWFEETESSDFQPLWQTPFSG
ncbi:MAG: o-succinylbenzoate synthase [Stenomitos rutilans HA7619-LM2]|jgi:O-succinylbenzoate synthase|nr:o-succinylbenzoate synthase [Stenomitos rutilans HA7619-LM2]